MSAIYVIFNRSEFGGQYKLKQACYKLTALITNDDIKDAMIRRCHKIFPETQIYDDFTSEYLTYLEYIKNSQRPRERTITTDRTNPS